MSLLTRIGVYPSHIEGQGGTTRPRMAAWRQAFCTGVDLREKGVQERLSTALKPAYTAAIEAFRKMPLAERFSLSQISHDEGYFKPSVLPQLGAEGIYVAPAIEVGKDIKFLLTRDNADQLKTCLTEEGQKQVANMVDGQFVGKAFITPAHILPGKVADFFAFFGKGDPAIVAKVEDLAAKGKTTKLLNNLYMPSRVFEAYVDRFYIDPEKNAGMKEMAVKLQEEGVVDSVLVMAALDLGLIPQDVRYIRMHEAWATHNSWENQAAVNYSDLLPEEQKKDNTILDTHMSMRVQLLPLIDAVKAIAIEQA